MTIQPLNDRVPIINPDGTPTQYFLRQLQDRGITVDGKITAEQAAEIANEIILEWSQDRDINTTSPLNGGGNLSTDLTLGLDNSGVTPGSYTNTDLTVDAFGRITAASNGSGGGGGSINSLGAPTGLLASLATPSVDFYIMKMLTASDAFTINKVAFETGSATASAVYRPFVYASSAAGVPGTLLGSGVTVTGTVSGYNEAPLSSSVSINKGDKVWVGVTVITAAIENLWHSQGLGAFASNGGSSTPAGTAPAITPVATLNGAYGFWAVT